jgi:glycosyltransferase involved in cell wall biosynthesis
MTSTHRRRLAIVTPNFFPRVCGVGDNSLRLAQEMLRRGHEVEIFSRYPIEPHPEAPGLAVTGASGSVPAVVAHRLASAIERYRPTEVVLQYTNQMWNAWRFGSPTMALFLRRLRKTGVRLTVIAHELFVPWLPRPDLFAAAALQRAQLMLLVPQTDRFFVTTGTRAQLVTPLFRAVGAVAPQLIRIGSNAMPVERWRKPGAGPKLGFFSTAAVGKRYDIVLDAFARIALEMPTAELLLIGDLGPPHFRTVRAVQAAVSRHPAQQRIRLTGRLSLAEVAHETAGLDVYLFPMDTGANTRSSTLPSALGSGIPTVAVRGRETDPDLFRDGENVIFADDMSGPAFAAAALRLLRDPATAARVGEGGRRLYDEHLSWSRIGDRLLAD